MVLNAIRAQFAAFWVIAAIVTKEAAGEGNTVYLVGHYTESTYAEGNLWTGELDQLLEQAVNWAAGDDVFGF